MDHQSVFLAIHPRYIPAISYLLAVGRWTEFIEVLIVWQFHFILLLDLKKFKILDFQILSVGKSDISFVH